MEKFKKNIWNIIGVIGTIATLFFGIYGLVVIPDYVKDANRQRQENANNEVVNDIKEVVFSSIPLDSFLVPNLIKGKEIKYNIIYPKSSTEVLIETQESFISDKFIPLEKRFVLYERIDSLKEITPKDKPVIQKADTKKSAFTFFTYALSILSLIISGLLLFGLLTRRKEQISEELEEKFEEIQENIPSTFIEYRKLENLVSEALNKLSIGFEDFTKNPRDFAFDFLIKQNDKKIGIEVKSRLRPNVIMRIRNQFDNSGLNALIIVTNEVVDYSTYSMLSDFKKKTRIAGRKIYFISAKDLENLKYELTEVLKREK